MRALGRQHFYLGVSSQEVGTNDDVKGVSVQHSAVFGHSYVAKTNSHIHCPPGMDGTSIPNIMATVLVFLKVFSRCRATIESVAPLSSTARKT